MTSFIAIGSNLGNRKENIEKAIKKVIENNLNLLEVSPIYETPACLLFENSINEWNIPYLNCVIKVETDVSAFELLSILKNIEKDMGRDFSKRWSPRVIDLDIIFHNDEKINTENLIVPHKLYQERQFVLDPLSFLDFSKVKNLNFYEDGHQPLIMGILNITSDSFSDGGINSNFENFKNNFENFCESNIGIIDIGAESTKPDAIKITSEEEITRLEKIFEYVKNKEFSYIKPMLSLDTYHYETAKIALQNGFDIINDVDGLDNVNMLNLAKENKNKKFIFMHHNDIKNISFNRTLQEIEKWLENKLNIFVKNNLNLDNLIFDAGIGFGKNASQSLLILQNIKIFHKYGIKILIGHSRKSFMNVFTNKNFNERDFQTLGISLGLCKNVDILRVHKAVEHKEAILAMSHLQNQFI